MKRTLSTILTVLTLILATMHPVSADTAPYRDVPQGMWYTDAVYWCRENKCMTGTSPDTFAPNATLTRAEFVQMLAKLHGAELDAVEYRDIFTDVPEDAWFTKAVIWAYDIGLTGGMGDGTFGAASPITRQQLAVFFCTYAKINGYDIGKKADLYRYEDNESIADWSWNATGWAVANGIISGTGDGVISPASYATRAQAAVILRAFATKSKGSFGTSLSDITVESRRIGAICAADIVGYTINGGYNDVATGLELFGAEEIFPFIKDITSDRIIDVGGAEIYCIIPASDDARVTVSPIELDSETYDEVVGAPVYEGGAEPIIVVCNVSDILSNVCITVTDSEGNLSFAPYISLRDGSVCFEKRGEGEIYRFNPTGSCAPGWKGAYLYQCNHQLIDAEYALIDIDEDGTPELYADTGITAYGATLYTFKNGRVKSLDMYTYGLYYIHDSNIFIDSGGHMDEYYDHVYKIENGDLICIARGRYGAENNAVPDSPYHYFWNETEVTQEQYQVSLNAVFDTANAVRPTTTPDFGSLFGIILF